MMTIDIYWKFDEYGDKEFLRVLNAKRKFWCDHKYYGEWFKDFNMKPIPNSGRVIGGKDTHYLDDNVSPESLISAFWMHPITPMITLYELTREFGGHEEGGWWYDDWNAIDTLSSDEIPDNYEDDAGYVTYNTRKEVFYGENNTQSKPFFC